jgi:hypothetical protein
MDEFLQGYMDKAPFERAVPNLVKNRNGYLYGYMKTAADVIGNKIPFAQSFFGNQGYDAAILAHGGHRPDRLPKGSHEFFQKVLGDDYLSTLREMSGYDPDQNIKEYGLSPDHRFFHTGNSSLFKKNLKKALRNTRCLYSNACTGRDVGPEYFEQFAPKLEKVTMGLPYSQVHPLNAILPNRFLRGEKIQPTRSYVLENGKWKDEGEYNNWLKRWLDIPFSKGPLPILAANRRERKQQDAIKKAGAKGAALINATRAAAVAGVDKERIHRYVGAMLKRRDSSGGPQFSLPKGGVARIREALARN